MPPHTSNFEISEKEKTRIRAGDETVRRRKEVAASDSALHNANSEPHRKMHSKDMKEHKRKVRDRPRSRSESSLHVTSGLGKQHKSKKSGEHHEKATRRRRNSHQTTSERSFHHAKGESEKKKHQSEDLLAKARQLRDETSGRIKAAPTESKARKSTTVGLDVRSDRSREMKCLRAKARSIRRKSTTQNDLLQQAVDLNKKHKTGTETAKAAPGTLKQAMTKAIPLRRSSSDSSLKLADVFASNDTQNGSVSTNNDASESQESVFERMSHSLASLSSISTYFESLNISRGNEELAERSVDTRRLLFLGQHATRDQDKAQRVLEDKSEWRHIQMELKKSGVTTNGGARQVLNPLLEQSEKDGNAHDQRKPPPFIFVDESASSEHSSVK